MQRRDFLHRMAMASMGAPLISALGTSVRPSRSYAPEHTDVFVSGRGYPSYRIPSLVATRQGTLLAICEGREVHSDHAANDLVMRRSTDWGKTWKARQVIAEDGDNVLINPCAAVLASGRVLLMYQWFPAGYHTRAIGEDITRLTPGLHGDTISKTMVRHSDDDGETWSAPRDVTAGTKRPAPILSTATGPGIGIQLCQGPYKGCILMPTNEGWFEGGRHRFNVYACYSDDGGQTWQYGQPAPNGGEGDGNEVQMVEVAGGNVLLNSRSWQGNKCRKVALSRDGGEMWSPLVDDSMLIEPECQGTILHYGGPPDRERSRVLFANPASKEVRVNGTVRLSYDGGRTWPEAKTIYDGSFAYSCLTMLSDGAIGLLYERDGYDKITFACFSLGWLTAGEH